MYVVLECLDCDLRDLLDGEKQLDMWQIKVCYGITAGARGDLLRRREGLPVLLVLHAQLIIMQHTFWRSVQCAAVSWQSRSERCRQCFRGGKPAQLATPSAACCGTQCCRS